MGKYGEVAVKAVEDFQAGRAKTVTDAWDVAAQQVFPISLSAQQKGCPKSTFLGLCELGLVSGVS
jgi:hypothetical protein